MNAEQLKKIARDLRLQAGVIDLWTSDPDTFSDASILGTVVILRELTDKLAALDTDAERSAMPNLTESD